MKDKKEINKNNENELENMNIISKDYSSSSNKNFDIAKNIIKILNYLKLIVVILICSLIFCLFLFKNESMNHNRQKINYRETPFYNLIDLDKYEVNKYNEIKKTIIKAGCSQMSNKEREFINGIIRKFKPKKILEVGVYHGGSSVIILNAIDDMRESKFYSIELDSGDFVGDCVNKYFPQFLKNWKLYKGNIATEYMEIIGKEIDMVIIDTAHYEPGEIIDFLIVLPFLKEEAIVIFHDIKAQFMSKTREEWAPYIIFNGIRGTKFYPSGNYILNHNIGAIKLEKNQKSFYKDYFRLLGGEWQYFPKEIHISLIRNYFKKYYEKECLIMFEETITFNRNFVKQNPKLIQYNKTIDH